MAVLEERERFARELHDTVGQVLGYVKLQAQGIRKRLSSGDTDTADAQLARLAQVAGEAHEDVRHAIACLKEGRTEGRSFVPTLEKYLKSFGANYGIETGLTLPARLDELEFAAGAGPQLMRVIQEATTNARMHGEAQHVDVAIELADASARVVVADDGCGFDPDRVTGAQGSGFGLAFMAERMAQMGGRATVRSLPGKGTMVVLDMPLALRSKVGA